MGPCNNDDAFHTAGQYRGDGRSLYAKGRTSENAEDQDIVQNQIDKYRSHAGNHGYNRFSRFTDRIGISAADGKGNQSQHHNGEVFFSIFEGEGNIPDAAAVAEIKGDKLGAAGAEKQQGDPSNEQAGIQLKAEGVLLPLIVPFSVELGAEDPGAGNTAENADIKDKDQLVDDGDSRHLFGADLSHHNIIQKADKAGNGVLNDQRDSQSQHIPVKLPVSDEFVFEFLPHKNTPLNHGNKGLTNCLRQNIVMDENDFVN